MIKKGYTFLVCAAIVMCIATAGTAKVLSASALQVPADNNEQSLQKPDTQQDVSRKKPRKHGDEKPKEKPEGLQHKFARLEKGKPPFLVVLSGQKQKDSPYYKDVRVKIYSKESKESVAEIVPSTDSGYSPSIFVGNFDNSGTQQIMLSLQSGGSGAFGYYYIYSFDSGKVTTIFDYEQFSKQNTYSAAYRDHYKVEVWCGAANCAGNRFIIDISRKGASYLEQLYNQDGTLIAPKTAQVSDLNIVMPVFMAQDNRYNIQVLQRVTGLYNADLLGYVTTVQSLDTGSFKNVYTTLQVLPFN